jgi:hypothetical protein
MANNRHAYNRDVIQSYWTSDVVSRLVRKHTQTNNVKDLPRSCRPRVTSTLSIFYCSIHRVEAVIQARGGYTRYWTLNNRCRQVIHETETSSRLTNGSCAMSLNYNHVSTGCNPHVLEWRPQPCVSSLQLDVGCPVVIPGSCCHSRCNAASNWW